jgi:hypothetical protein
MSGMGVRNAGSEQAYPTIRPIEKRMVAGGTPSLPLRAFCRLGVVGGLSGIVAIGDILASSQFPARRFPEGPIHAREFAAAAF